MNGIANSLGTVRVHSIKDEEYMFILQYALFNAKNNDKALVAPLHEPVRPPCFDVAVRDPSVPSEMLPSSIGRVTLGRCSAVRPSHAVLRLILLINATNLHRLEAGYCGIEVMLKAREPQVGPGCI